MTASRVVGAVARHDFATRNVVGARHTGVVALGRAFDSPWRDNRTTQRTDTPLGREKPSGESKAEIDAGAKPNGGLYSASASRYDERSRLKILSSEADLSLGEERSQCSG